MSALTIYDEHGIFSERKRSGGYEMRAMHIHDMYEIFLSLSDGLKFFVNDRVYPIGRGDVMLFSNIDLHRISAPTNRPYERYVVTFSPDMLPVGGEDYGGLLDCFAHRDGLADHMLSLSDDEQREFIALASAIEEEGRAAAYGKVGQSLALCRLLLFINRVRLREPRELPPIMYSAHPQVRLVIDYIDANYDRAIRLDELSALCYLNKHYLCRLFRRETGFCIHDYMTFRRLSHAIAFLRSGESVGSTARLTGFESDTFFITTFKKNIGITPYKYACSRRGHERTGSRA